MDRGAINPLSPKPTFARFEQRRSERVPGSSLIAGKSSGFSADRVTIGPIFLDKPEPRYEIRCLSITKTMVCLVCDARAKRGSYARRDLSREGPGRNFVRYGCLRDDCNVCGDSIVFNRSIVLL